MKFTLDHDIELYANCLKEKQKAFEDSQWHLKMAKSDLRSAKKAALKLKTQPIKSLIKTLEPWLNRVSVTGGVIYMMTRQLPSNAIPDSFKPFNHRSCGFEQHDEYADFVLRVHIYNVYDPRKPLI